MLRAEPDARHGDGRLDDRRNPYFCRLDSTSLTSVGSRIGHPTAYCMKGFGHRVWRKLARLITVAEAQSHASITRPVRRHLDARNRWTDLRACDSHGPGRWNLRIERDRRVATEPGSNLLFQTTIMLVHACRTFAILLALAAGVPCGAFAQAIAGVVHDASGAALPDVTVQAESAALIEKVRTVVTDGSGQYRIENLRPGTYTVTFTREGFRPYVRDGSPDHERVHGQRQRATRARPGSRKPSP